MENFNFFFNNDNLYFNILDGLPEAIYIYNTRKELVYLNKAAEKLDGYTLQYGKGKTIFELYDFGHDLNAKRSPILITLRTEHPIQNHEISYYMNGEKITQICSTAPIYSNGTLIGAYIIQRDITNIQNIVEENINLKQEIQHQKAQLSSDAPAFTKTSNLIGNSKLFVQCKELSLKAARTDSNIMLIGATGSGKEVFANTIHNSSSRSKGSFLALNCAAIPESLIEGILFGTTKGVYTGAIEKEGLLAQANGGTVFLDEINSMPLTSQAKLLRILEERSIMKLGSGKEIPIDVRIISSTNEFPQQAIDNQHLRDDLFYRLSVVQIIIPPLKDRKEDIPLLVDSFIKKYNQRFQKNIFGVTPEVLKYFMNFSWPGNIRQLKSCIESAMNFAENGQMISMEDLPQYILNNFQTTTERYHQIPQISRENPDTIQPKDMSPSSESPKKEIKVLDEIKEQKRLEIIEALRASEGNITNAAKFMGISKQLLYYHIKKFNIK